MRRKVYRSLDRPASVFGIRGRWLIVTGLGAALSLIVGLAAGRATSMLVGIGVALLLGAGAYLLTLALQSRVDERDLWKMVVKRSYPRVYRFPPKHIRNIWRGFNLSPCERLPR